MTKHANKNAEAYTKHANENAGRNTPPESKMVAPTLVKRIVENVFPFELEFGNDSILIKTVFDEGSTVPILVGAKIPGLVHGILNATTAIWKNSYPVFEVGYMYLHRTLDEARLTLADDNVGYVFGCPRLVEEVNEVSSSALLVRSRWIPGTVSIGTRHTSLCGKLLNMSTLLANQSGVNMIATLSAS